MMKKIRKFAALVLTLCVLVSLAVPALAASGVQSELQGSAAYMLSAVKAPEAARAGAASEARTQSVRTRAANLRIFFIMDPS